MIPARVPAIKEKAGQDLREKKTHLPTWVLPLEKVL
jgi:hypothetical protein